MTKEKAISQESKVPPQDQNAEKAILGGILINNDHFSELVVNFPVEAFYREAHGNIFQAMLDLYKEDKEIDLITLGNQLEKNNKMDQSGGMDYLVSLIENNITSAGWPHHKQIILDLYQKRKTIQICSSVCEQLYTSWMSNEEALNLLDDHVIQNFNRYSNRSDLTPVGDIIEKSFKDMETASLSEDGITGLNTGYTDLNRYTNGLQNSDLIVIAGRPSMGKSSLSLSLAYNMSLKGKIGAIFSLEMSKEQNVNRLLSFDSKIDSKKIRSGRLRDSDWTQITHTAGNLSNFPLYIDDTSGISLTEMRSKLKNLIKRAGGLDYFIVDYIQLMTGSKRDQRHLEIGEYTQGIKALAKDFGVPAIALAQLSRKVEERPNKRPQMSDLRESGSIENDADVILLIYRDEVYNPTTDENRNIAEINLAKQRNGETGTFKMTFLKEFTLFKDYVDESGYPAYDWQQRKDN